MNMQSPLLYPTTIQASVAPDRPAIIGDNGMVTHAELEGRIVAAARRLVALGIGPGDRVAMSAPNSLEWVVIAHAVVRLGAALVPLSTRLAPAEFLQQMELFNPRLTFADNRPYEILAREPAFAGRLVLLEQSTDRARRSWETISPAPVEIGPEADPERVGTIISTSGSTGPPKGVCLTLANHLRAADSSRRNLDNTAADRWLVNMPFYHIGGLAILFRAATSGLSMVIHDHFDAERTIDAIGHQAITHLSVVENTLRRLLDAWESRPGPSKLRAVLAGGGPVDVELLRRARMLGIPVLPTYGLTEASSQVATLHPDAPVAKLMTAGRPLPQCEVEIRNPEGDIAPPETEGEIAIRGPMVATKYWSRSGETTARAPDGWLATHDIGVLDTDGYLTISGRMDDMIISGGEKVFPAEVENALSHIPGIRRAVVLGIADPRWGQAPVAMIEIEGSALDHAAMIALLNNRLAHYKIPRTFIPVPSIPLTDNGKIDRRRARELYRQLAPNQQFDS